MQGDLFVTNEAAVRPIILLVAGRALQHLRGLSDPSVCLSLFLLKRVLHVVRQTAEFGHGTLLKLLHANAQWLDQGDHLVAQAENFFHVLLQAFLLIFLCLGSRLSLLCERLFAAAPLTLEIHKALRRSRVDQGFSNMVEAGQKYSM